MGTKRGKLGIARKRLQVPSRAIWGCENVKLSNGGGGGKRARTKGDKRPAPGEKKNAFGHNKNVGHIQKNGGKDVFVEERE